MNKKKKRKRNVYTI